MKNNDNHNKIKTLIRSENIITFFFSFDLKCKGAAKLFVYCASIIFLVSLWSCKKLVETPIPTDQVAENSVYTNNATAIAVLTAIYTAMNTGPIQGTNLTSVGCISVNMGLAADEFKLTRPFISNTNFNWIKYYQNDLFQDPLGKSGGEHWAPLYSFIFKCNAAISGLSSSSSNGLTPKIRQQLLGEAEFMRAFSYFYLVNEFGDVPLVLTTDPQTNLALPRATKQSVYDQIVKDLLDAEDKLSSDYLDVTLLNVTNERVRPTKWAAAALLARVYLYTGVFDKAEQQATLVLNNTTLFGLPSLNSVFLKNSGEAIWQIQPTDLNYNTREGQGLIIPATGPSTGGGFITPVQLSTQLLNSFETNDQRAQLGNWINTRIYKGTSSPLVYDTVPYAYKYKIASSTGVNSVSALTEYFMVLRLAEQYLIRAEARAQQGNFGDAQSDLNAIRTRAGLPSTTASDKTSLLAAVLHERQVELFAEWGHRWFDLKRTGNVDAVMSIVTPQKTGGSPIWRSYQQLFPVPFEAMTSSPNLTQNSGY
jgi:hypothetical protein